MGAQTNHLNLREKERERERERERKKEIAGQMVTINANVLNKTVFPITINETFDPTNRSAHIF